MTANDSATGSVPEGVSGQSEQIPEGQRRAAVQTRKRPARAEVSIVIPVINETFSLRETVRILLDQNRDDLCEIALVVAPRTTADSHEVIQDLIDQEPELVWTHTQTLPYIGGALREAFACVCGTYTVLMASDLETDPNLVKDLVREIRNSEVDIVTASRWRADKGEQFYGYHPVKLRLNWVFQHLMSVLFLSSLSDMTYGYRIFRTEVLWEVRWEELKHPFLLETIVKPLRLGRRTKEIPAATWTPRREGQSQMTLRTYWGYLRIALKTRLRPRKTVRRKA